MTKKRIISFSLCLCFLLGGCGVTTYQATNQIAVVSREGGSGTRGSFVDIFKIEERDGETRTDKTTPEADIVNKTDVMLTMVSGNPSAIGYVSLGSLSNRVKAVAIDGVYPTAETIRQRSYRAFRAFYIATGADLSPEAADFITFILSEQGQAVVAGAYVPVDEMPETYTSRDLKGKIVIAGSSSVSPIMEKLREAYLLENPQMVLEVQQSDSSTGLRSAIEGTCDIGMSSRDLKENEKEVLTEQAIALDGLAIIVNPENTTDALTSEQVREIFTGEILTWTLQKTQ